MMWFGRLGEPVAWPRLAKKYGLPCNKGDMGDGQKKRHIEATPAQCIITPSSGGLLELIGRNTFE